MATTPHPIAPTRPRRSADEPGARIRGHVAGGRVRHSPSASVLLLSTLVFVAAASPSYGQVAQPSSQPRADQQVIMITGSTDGLGREVALRLAGPGVHLIVHGRNQERGAEVVASIQEKGGTARFYAADLGSLDQVRQLGQAILRDYQRLDVLINNAGIWLEASEGRRLSADGHELHFAVNYLSGFLLTRMLLPTLVRSAPARIINVASAAQTPLDFSDVMLERNYSDGRGYGQSKLAQILFTVDLAQELEGTGVTVNSLHPATMMNTSMVLSRGAPTRSTVDEGAEAVLHLVTAPDLGSGQYFNGTRAMRANAQAYDEEARARLRILSQELTRAP